VRSDQKSPCHLEPVDVTRVDQVDARPISVRVAYTPMVSWEGVLRIRDCQFDSRIDHSHHLAFGDFALGENGCRVIAGDSGTTAACQLRRPERGDRNELERSHQVWRADHRAPAVRPKKAAVRRPMTAAAIDAMRTLRFTARSC
jgi:hypothetical protein